MVGDTKATEAYLECEKHGDPGKFCSTVGLVCAVLCSQEVSALAQQTCGRERPQAETHRCAVGLNKLNACNSCSTKVASNAWSPCPAIRYASYKT